MTWTVIGTIFEGLLSRNGWKLFSVNDVALKIRGMCECAERGRVRGVEEWEIRSLTSKMKLKNSSCQVCLNVAKVNGAPSDTRCSKRSSKRYTSCSCVGMRIAIVNCQSQRKTADGPRKLS